jgi:hypothetical protein
MKNVVTVEVHNARSQPAVLRTVQLGKRCQSGTAGRQAIFTTAVGFHLFPAPPDELSRTIHPTDSACFDVTFSQLRDCWGEGKIVPLQARISRGDGKMLESNVILAKDTA